MPKVHSTNYTNTFIEVATDCPVDHGEVPPEKKNKSVAHYQFELISGAPYKYTSDDIFFLIYALRNEVAESDYSAERVRFFSKGHPCFRASPLCKRYGWGVHSNEKGRVAIFPVNSAAYQKRCEDASLTKVKAMRNKR